MSKDDKPTKLEPRLRFPEFKGSAGWDTPAMSALYGFCPTNTLSRDQLNYDAGSIYNIHYGDIHTKFQTQFRLDNERVPFINPTVAEELGDRFTLCREGDIILADASEDLNDVGKAIELISLGDHRVVAGTHTIHATRLDDNPAIGFGGYLFKSAAVRRGIHKEAQGAKVYGISSTRIASIRLPLPPKAAEQRKIAACLGSLDDWIAAETDALAALRQHKTGLMQQLFPQPGETRPRLRFPEFRDAGDWEERQLGPLTSKVGSGITPLGGSANYLESGRPFMRSQNVGWGTLLLDDIAYIDEEMHHSFDGTEIRSDDVLLNITGASIGRSAVADERIVGGNVNQHVCIIRTDPQQLDARMLNQYLISSLGQDQIDSFQAGGNRQGLNFNQIRSFGLPLPPDLDEQKCIAECLSSLDAHISAQDAKLAALHRHKRGLMQQLFPAADATEGVG